MTDCTFPLKLKEQVFFAFQVRTGVSATLPEAMLSVEFKDNTNMDEVLRTLPKTSDYGITSLVGVTTIEGKDFPVTVSEGIDNPLNIYNIKKE